MSDPVREALVLVCPTDRRVCNCGHGLESFFPASEGGCYRTDEAGRMIAVDHWACKWGCSATQMEATRMLAEAYLKAINGG